MGKGRRPCCDKAGVKKGPWSQAEDFKLISFIQNHGYSNWRALPKLAGLARCGKSCRLRWVNYLRPDLKRGFFTLREEEAIIKLHEELGNKWSKIASKFPGRTDNEIKNVWNTHLKKRIKDKESREQYQESCNSSPTSTITNEAIDVSILNDGSEHKLVHQSSTVDDTMEQTSSSSTSYYSSAPPFSVHDMQEMEDLDPILDDLGNLSTNMIISTCDKDEERFTYDKCIENNTLQELTEIPFEPNFDLWDLLGGDQSSSVDITDAHFSDIGIPLQLAIQTDNKSSDSVNDMECGGSWWWQLYLENELGLDHNEAISSQ